MPPRQKKDPAPVEPAPAPAPAPELPKDPSVEVPPADDQPGVPTGEVTDETKPDDGAVAPATQEPYGEDVPVGQLPAPTEGLIGSNSAPLEAPAPPPKTETEADANAADHAPQSAGNLGADLVRHARPGARLVDQATNKAPDPDTLFVKLDGPGVMVRCTVRLCQDSWIGPHENPIRQLVMPAGQITGPEKAAQILAALREQIAADAEPEAEAAAE